MEASVVSPICFENTDFETEVLPPPGFYEATVCSARFRQSTQGNLMLHVIFELHGVVAPNDHVADYFVLEGAPRAVTVARGRVVRLYRACGLSPQQGDEISPADLFSSRLEVKVDHDEWRGRPRLRVLACRPRTAAQERSDSTPF